MKCERCQKNSAQVRVDQMVEGRRESHFLCQSCVDELMRLMEQADSFDGPETSGAPLVLIPMVTILLLLLLHALIV
ncbi:hypothetical protein KDW_52420 [Dictyobacter vulcani]|uniref:Uncharacterized protein n=1 Tax=Dictyobacter vulcani TaxID=2607529 RepID=A0A5J4KX14_9CHLR|nr:hypothetical protein KDW_52420 [Dictyobacter vulcani]